MQLTSAVSEIGNHASQTVPLPLDVEQSPSTRLHQPLPTSRSPFSRAEITLQTAWFDRAPFDFRIGFAVWELSSKRTVDWNIPFSWNYRICQLASSFAGRCWRLPSLHAHVGYQQFQRCRIQFQGCERQCGQCLLPAGGRLFQFQRCSSKSREHRNANRRNLQMLGKGPRIADWRIESCQPFAVRDT